MIEAKANVQRLGLKLSVWYGLASVNGGKVELSRFRRACGSWDPRHSQLDFEAIFPFCHCSRIFHRHSHSLRTAVIMNRVRGFLLLWAYLDLSLLYLDRQILTATGFFQPGNIHWLDTTSHGV